MDFEAGRENRGQRQLQVSKGQLMQRGITEGCHKVTLWGCDKRAERVQKWGRIEVIGRANLPLKCTIHMTLKLFSVHLAIRVYTGTWCKNPVSGSCVALILLPCALLAAIV